MAVPRTTTPKQRSNKSQSLAGGGSANSALEQTIQGDPAAIQLIQRSILSKPQGPTTRAAAGFVDWNKLNQELGQPFDAELVPFSKLRQMRRDPMIGFGLHYIKTPLVRAPWKIEAKDSTGPRPDIAAFVDAAIRPIYARYIFQHTLALDFGFSPMVKQFKMEAPQGTYFDINGNEVPIWAQGNILPVVFKAFKPLPPWESKAAFDKATGEFAGIIWRGKSQDDAQGSKQGGGAGGDDAPTIDVFHSLWSTNDRDSVFDSLYGYPRINYAYRYWWSWNFRWTQSDRAFERFATPPMVGRYPEGIYTDEDGVQYSNLDVMLDALEQIRSNGGVALPSGVVQADDGSKTNVPEWSIEFLKSDAPQNAFDKVFNYLDVLKLRSVFVPEQAFIEGEGGSSSRNVAAQMAEIFIESQSNLMAEIDYHINNYMIPHLLVINFPEFIGSCQKVTTGFTTDDIDFMKQMIQLIGQNPDSAGVLPVDIRAAMERAGIPLLTPQQQDQQKQDLIKQAAQAAPALSGNKPGTTAVIPNQGSPTGFSYMAMQPDNLIQLSDDASFMSKLPNVEIWETRDMKAATTKLQASWARYYANAYSDFANHVERMGATAMLSAQTPPQNSNTARNIAAGVLTYVAAKQVAQTIVDTWQAPTEALLSVTELTGSLIKKVIGLASKLETKRAKINTVDLTEEDVSTWSSERLGHLVATTDSTVRTELTNFVADRIMEGKDPKQIAKDITEHFHDYPQWKADRVARTEAQTAYNTGTIFTAQAAGIPELLAHDASDGADQTTDEECINRDGKKFDHAAALRENEDEHPNGSLYFTLIP